LGPARGVSGEASNHQSKRHFKDGPIRLAPAIGHGRIRAKQIDESRIRSSLKTLLD